jgi:hypothetical protein
MTEMVVQQQSTELERVLIAGDLARLQPNERVMYYKAVCESVGLNPLTKPFEYITLNGKLTLYARRDATDQLRQIKGVSIEIKAREVVEDCYIVTACAKIGTRQDESIGAVTIGGLKGESRANAMMKAETKAKRRVTLSICGLGMLDETEVETITPIPASSKSVAAFEYEQLPADRRQSLDQIAAEIVTTFKDTGSEEAYDMYVAARDNLDLIEEKAAMKALIPSNIRTMFGKIVAARKAAEKDAPPISDAAHHSMEKVESMKGLDHARD